MLCVTDELPIYRFSDLANVLKDAFAHSAMNFSYSSLR